MTKADLLRVLKPFADDTEIDIAFNDTRPGTPLSWRYELRDGTGVFVLFDDSALEHLARAPSDEGRK